MSYLEVAHELTLRKIWDSSPKHVRYVILRDMTDSFSFAKGSLISASKLSEKDYVVTYGSKARKVSPSDWTPPPRISAVSLHSVRIEVKGRSLFSS